MPAKRPREHRRTFRCVEKNEAGEACIQRGRANRPVLQSGFHILKIELCWSDGEDRRVWERRSDAVRPVVYGKKEGSADDAGPGEGATQRARSKRFVRR